MNQHALWKRWLPFSYQTLLKGMSTMRQKKISERLMEILSLTNRSPLSLAETSSVCCRQLFYGSCQTKERSLKRKAWTNEGCLNVRRISFMACVLMLLACQWMVIRRSLLRSSSSSWSWFLVLWIKEEEWRTAWAIWRYLWINQWFPFISGMKNHCWFKGPCK